MKNIFLSLMVLATLFIFAKPPKKDNNSNQWIENKTIYGKWLWFKTECCGKKKGITTPDSYGDNILLELLADNTFIENATKHRVPRNGKVSIFKVTNNEKTIRTIQFNDERPAHYSLSQNGDTLILSWEYLELQKEYYYRTK